MNVIRKDEIFTIILYRHFVVFYCCVEFFDISTVMNYTRDEGGIEHGRRGRISNVKT